MPARSGTSREWNLRADRRFAAAAAALSILLSASAACHAGSKELLDRIAPHVPVKADLPPDWEIRDEVPSDNRDYGRMRDFIDPIVEESPGCFAYKVQGIEVGGYTYVLCVVSFKDEAALGEFNYALKKRKKAYHFRLGLLIFTVWPAYDVVGMRIEDAVSYRYAVPRLEEIEKAAGSGLNDRAWGMLADLTEEIGISARFCMRSAEICLSRLVPPRVDQAKEYLETALRISGRMPLSPEDLVAANMGLARIDMVKGDRPSAQERLRRALDAAGGLDRELELLAEFARIEASRGYADGCLDTLEKAVRFEACQGGNEILKAAGEDPAFSGVVRLKRFRDLEKKYGKLDKFATHANPGMPRLSPSPTPLFVWPPSVAIGGARDRAAESEMEANLLRECARQSVAFGSRRDALAAEGKDDCSGFLCAHSCRAVIREGTFDLKSYLGGRERIAEYAGKVADIAKSAGLAPAVPGLCLAVDVEIRESAGDAAIRIKAVLYETSANRVLVLLASRRSAPARDMCKAMADLPSEIIRALGSAVRKAG